MNRVYVGNIPFTTTEDDLYIFFGPVCRPRQVRIMTDRDTGQPRGFAFVDLDNQRDVADACEKLNRQNFNGRTVVVNAARERPVDANNAPRPKQDRKPFVPKPPREPRRGGGKRRHDDNDDYGW